MNDVDRGPWVTTRSGGKFFLNDPRPEDFNIMDMAAGISKDCRYGGQLSEQYDDEIYSVAQHSVYVHNLIHFLAPPEQARRAAPWAIMHDAIEGIYGDMVSPQKSITPSYVEREERAEAALIQRYMIPADAEVRALVHRADKMVSVMEADVLCAGSTDIWHRSEDPIMPLLDLDRDFECWRPKRARDAFIDVAVGVLGKSILNLGNTMPTHLNLRYAEIESVWPGVEALQDLADQYGIPDVFQDAGGKMLQLAVATGLDLIPGRTGPDARDRMGNLYEVKTVDLSNKTKGGFTTNHHLTRDTISRYRSRRWVFAIYERITLMEAYLVEATDLDPIFRKWEFDLRSKDHINNPKISSEYIREVGTVMYMKDVAPAWMPEKREGS